MIPETVRVPAEDVLHIYRPIDAGQIRGLPHVAPAMVRLFLLDQYDDAELDRKKTAAMFAGFITKTAPEDPMMGEAEADLDGAAIASLEPGTMQVLLPGEDVKFSSPPMWVAAMRRSSTARCWRSRPRWGCPITWSPAMCARPTIPACGQNWSSSAAASASCSTG